MISRTTLASSSTGPSAASFIHRVAQVTLLAVACGTVALPAYSADNARIEKPYLPHQPVKLFGDPAPPEAATRTIVITPDTRWVNVEGGEIIRFIVGDRSFGWSFFVGETVSSFELNRVAPPGLLPRQVIAYVSPDPRYIAF